MRFPIFKLKLFPMKSFQTNFLPVECVFIALISNLKFSTIPIHALFGYNLIGENYFPITHLFVEMKNRNVPFQQHFPQQYFVFLP